MEDISKKNFPRFGGSFFTWKTVLNTDREKGTQDVLLVFSSGSREAVLRFLWHKHVWSQLSFTEFQLFFLNLKDRSDKEWSFTKKAHLIPKAILRKRLNFWETRLGQEVTSRESLIGMYRIRIEIRKETRRLPKPTKYSGYVRSPSSVGSKQPVRQFLDEMIPQGDIWSIDDRTLSWDELLSVDFVS